MAALKDRTGIPCVWAVNEALPALQNSNPRTGWCKPSREGGPAHPRADDHYIDCFVHEFPLG